MEEITLSLQALRLRWCGRARGPAVVSFDPGSLGWRALLTPALSCQNSSGKRLRSKFPFQWSSVLDLR